MKIIKASNGQDIQVDDCYYEHLSQFTWSINAYGYARSGMGLGSGACVCMHRWVAEQENMDAPTYVDHKDRNKLNNQASNLRPATNSENQVNSSKRANCTSVYKGVTYYKPRNTWRARLFKKRKSLLNNYFATEVEAAKAYDKAAFEAYGEFAVLNFPEDYAHLLGN